MNDQIEKCVYINFIADNIGKTPDKIIEMFQEGNAMPSDEAKRMGFISEIEEFAAAPGLPIFSITNQT